jgi:hypothetical protein
MAKWHGVIGYAETVKTSPGVYQDTIVEHKYAGDVIRNSSRWSASSDSTNDDLTINNRFSIIADPFAYQNFHSIKYVEYMGTKWKVTDVEVQYPRLILNVGGVYNGK